MFNDQRIDTLRQQIQASALLSDHEKGDWLNLLELMNDKQLGELEEILATGGSLPAPMSTPAPTRTPPTVSLAPKMPQLSHIANIPTDISIKAPAKTPPTVSPPTATPAPQPAHPSAPPLRQQATQQPSFPRLAQPPHPPQVAKLFKSVEPPKPAQPPQPSEPRKPTFDVEKLDDFQALTLDTLRQFDLQSIVDVVRAAIQQYGYFRILQLLESSPLYEAYIEAGSEQLRMAIGQPNSDKIILTRAEFEFMTDLLRSMRFNRW